MTTNDFGLATISELVPSFLSDFRTDDQIEPFPLAESATAGVSEAPLL
jgi:hypothetical protein